MFALQNFIFVSSKFHVFSICLCLYQRSRIFRWDGTPRNRNQWQKLENINLELPKDTLIEVEQVEELRGEVRLVELIENPVFDLASLFARTTIMLRSFVFVDSRYVNQIGCEPFLTSNDVGCLPL